MHIVIQICNSDALEEFVYSAYNAEGSKIIRDIRLPGDRFNITSDSEVSLSISLQGLTLRENNSNVFFINNNKSQTCESIITKDSLYKLITKNKEELNMYIFFGNEDGMRFYEMKRGRPVSLGRSLGNLISCPEREDLSGTHLIFLATEEGGRLNVKGRSGCYLNDRYVGYMESVAVKFGDVIRVLGLKIVWMDNCIGILKLYMKNKALPSRELCLVRLKEYTDTEEIYIREAKKDNGYFYPVQRNKVMPDESEIELDSPPAKKEIKKPSLIMSVGPALTMAIPMSLGYGLYIYAAGRMGTGKIAIYMYTGLVTAFASAILGALWAILNLRNNRIRMVSEEALRQKSYSDYIKSSEKLIYDKFRYNTNAYLRNYPSAKEMLTSVNMSGLWNRRKGDSDLYVYRLGLGQQPFKVSIKVPREKFQTIPDELCGLPMTLKKKYSMLSDVPVCIDISEDTFIGLVAEKSNNLADLFISLSMQIAASTDAYLIKFIFIFSNNIIPEEIVEYMHWLPHLQGDDEHYVCIDSERIDELLCGIEQIISDAEESGKRILIFTDDRQRVTLKLLEYENVSIFLFANDYRDLPGECDLLIQNDSSFKGLINLRKGGERKEIRFDHYSEAEVYDQVRKLSSLRLKKASIKKPIPSKVTLPMLFNVDFITTEFILEGWKENTPLNSLRAPIGMGEDGRIIFLDIHEKAHGPHGLIAGMTGSGKSEMLQTFILSLAIRYSPEQIGFFLIDYKGGGMANMFGKLPHLLGSISNLSGNMIHRALVAIRSENVRRQRLFLKAGVNSIRDYSLLYENRRVTEPLVHILIIVDEFAELKKEEPDFMKELISVAQVGRSLGVHLILSTQKPAGTVDEKIFANSRFRICLRVQDKQDSNDMLHRPDAAYIANPGRAYLQVGNDELFDVFQVGYTMEKYRKEVNSEPEIFWLDKYRRRKKLCLINDDSKGIRNRDDTESPVTHFSGIMEMLCESNERVNLPVISGLWLPPLPKRIVLKAAAKAAGGIEKYDVVAGRYDAPAKQEQGDYLFNPIRNGHHVIIGSSQSGKSTFLQTVIYEYIYNLTASDINIYIVDYSNGLLSCFKESNLVGGYIDEEHKDRLENLFCMLDEEMNIRRNAYNGVSFIQKVEEEENAAIVLVIDNYGSFRDKNEMRYDNELQKLVKSGESYGIYVVITGASIGSADIPVRLFENCRTGISLLLNDKYQYSECMRQIRLPILPDEGIRGRGLVRLEDDVLEFQTVLCCDGNDNERYKKIQENIRERNGSPGIKRAKQVPFIPDEPVLSELDDSIDTDTLKDYDIPFGYELQSARVWCLPFDKARIICVAGKAGSGRTNSCSIVEYYCKKRNIKLFKAGSLPKMCEILKREETGLLICDDYSGLLGDFYEKNYDKEIEESLMDLMDNKEGIKVFITLLNSDHKRLAGRRAYDLLREVCLGLYLGGGLDAQNIFDYTYLSFTEQNRVKPVGTATVLKKKKIAYAGDIITPLYERLMD
ncbi:MAG: type VII secretion protein EssC [Lachnospiraceae bacterium]|nr:type VII secretion protein EssC [Lachnospiraceae bacterium]